MKELKKSTLFYVLMSLVFLFFLSLWTEHSDQAQDFYNNWIEPYVDLPKFSIVWTVLLLAGGIVIHKFIMDNKEEEKLNLEKVLDSEMQILVMANRELNHYRLQDNLMMILNRFIEQNPYVNAAQWYHSRESKHQNKTNFKVSFQYGAVAEDVVVNAVQQIYYHCPTSTLRKFRKAKRIYTDADNPDLLVDFIIEIYETIMLKQDPLTKEDAFLCSLMLLSSEIIEKNYDLVFDDIYREKKIQDVLNENRTGLLRAALMEDEYYSFTHTRENEKNNRQYLARLIKVREEHIIFTIVLDSSILDEEDYEQMMLDITKSFEKLLKGLELGYNNGKKVRGD